MNIHDGCKMIYILLTVKHVTKPLLYPACKIKINDNCYKYIVQIPAPALYIHVPIFIECGDVERWK